MAAGTIPTRRPPGHHRDGHAGSGERHQFQARILTLRGLGNEYNRIIFYSYLRDRPAKNINSVAGITATWRLTSTLAR